MAEVELAVLSGQCLDRRIGEESLLRQEVAAWEVERNEQQVSYPLSCDLDLYPASLQSLASGMIGKQPQPVLLKKESP